MSRSYPAKLLLFGEYTVLNGSQALAVPLHCWKGSWAQHDIGELPSSLDYFFWLKNEHVVSDVIADAMIHDIKSGWQYISTVPIGFGVGSSGAYVAALFDRYVMEHVDVDDAARVMAKMESYFHGTSSGMDPLVSLTQHAVVKDDRGQFRTVTDPGLPDGWSMYLLNSGISRHTDSLVKTYRSMIEEPGFNLRIERELIPMVDHAIHFYLSSTSSMLQQCISLISQFQREYFQAMIPEAIRSRWDELNSLDGVYVKLCGAGGGGYFLVINTNAAETRLHDTNDLIDLRG
jgi:mevalonate kinase